MNGELNQIAITNAYNESLSVVYTNFAGYGYGKHTCSAKSETSMNGEFGMVNGEILEQEFFRVFKQSLTRGVTSGHYRRELISSVTNTFNGTHLTGYAYTYDPLKRPTLRNDDTFDYNQRNEVVSASVHSNLTNYAYDHIGNFTETSHAKYTANANNQYTAIDSAQLQYDADGNLTRDRQFTYSYDAENRLIQVEPFMATNGQVRIQNQYDYKHRRIRKTIQQLSGRSAGWPMDPNGCGSWNTVQTHDFTYDGWNLIHERITTEEGVSNIQYFWGLDLSGTLQGAGGVGGLLAASIDGNYYLTCYDANGNITAYVDSQGALVASYTYDAFGNTIASAGAMKNAFSFRFSTKYLDTYHPTLNSQLSTLNLYYYGYRFYSPHLSRWLNRDPLEEQGGLNLYAFCSNNGVSRFDVLGTTPYVIGNTPPPQTVNVNHTNWNTLRGWWIDEWDVKNRTRLTILGGRLAEMPDAANHLSHFLSNSGQKYSIRFERMNTESSDARLHYINELNDALKYAEMFLSTNNHVEIVTSTEAYAQNMSGNWLYAVGRYRTWAHGYALKCSNGEKFSMRWTFNFRDVYDWDITKDLGGGLVSDKEMGYLHRYGEAKEFEMVGQQVLRLSWTKGERYGSGLTIKEVNGFNDPRRSN